MARPHIVVDGSNIATEGRSAPSLKQLEEAVAELKREYPGAQVTVIVDATFAHRIDPSELDRFEKAALAGEYVHPPAGAIGRGDAFLLRVAEKVGATVLSNDSFQEFHGEHPWLFERGRLLGATPVPGVGWIFSPRSPVRGPASRQAMREVERAQRQVSKAIKEATKEAVAPPPVRKAAAPKIGDRAVLRSEASAPPPQSRLASPAAVNDPLTFVSFIAEHPLGAEVVGRVDSYTSHGAVVLVGSTQCYVPLPNLAQPPPRSAREVLNRGEDVTFVVHALDAQRRGVELALPGVGAVAGRPSEEMIAAEVRMARKRQPALRPTRSDSGAAAPAPAGAPAAKAAKKATKAAKPATARTTGADKPPAAKQPAAKAAGRAPAAKAVGAKAPAGKASPSEAPPAAAGAKAPAARGAAAKAPSTEPASQAETPARARTKATTVTKGASASKATKAAAPAEKTHKAVRKVKAGTTKAAGAANALKAAPVKVSRAKAAAQPVTAPPPAAGAGDPRRSPRTGGRSKGT